MSGLCIELRNHNFAKADLVVGSEKGRSPNNENLDTIKGDKRK